MGTFGKFCEYEFITMNTFEQTIGYQFHLKNKYRNGSQLWGNITCYTTLINCYSGLQCLVWQNICDGKFSLWQLNRETNRYRYTTMHGWYR
jgi:hypothetical protein